MSAEHRTKRRQIDRLMDQLHPRYSGRVYEARHELGCVINERPCTRHDHEGAVAEYVLIHSPRDTPTQLALSQSVLATQTRAEEIGKAT